MMRALIWLDDHVAEILLAIIFAGSLIPFFAPAWHGQLFYTFLGGWFGAGAWFVINRRTKYGGKNPLAVWMCLFVLVIGVSSFYFLADKMPRDPFSPCELFITTHYGALLGMMMVTIFSGLKT